MSDILSLRTVRKKKSDLPAVKPDKTFQENEHEKSEKKKRKEIELVTRRKWN